MLGAGALILLGGGGMFWWAWKHPTLEIKNNLLAPITLTLGDMPPVTVTPQSSRKLEVLRSQSSRYTWESGSVSSQPGAEAGGIPVTGVGTVSFSGNPFEPAVIAIAAADAENGYFAPLITNETPGPICMSVNRLPTREAVPPEACDAVVPGGAAGQYIGYFPLSAGAEVRAVSGAGQGATYRSFEHLVDRPTGRLNLVFSPRDFQPN